MRNPADIHPIQRLRRVLTPASAIALMSFSLTAGAAATAPTLPRTFDTTYAAPSGRVISVSAGGNLQAAVDSANPGDTISLAAGSTFTGPLALRNKSGSGWIYIQSSAYSKLPGPGTRVAISDAANMAKIVVPSSAVHAITTDTNAHHYRFVGIEISPTSNNYISTLIAIGGNDKSPSTLPNNIVFDRCYIHGDPTQGGRRGVEMDGQYIAVVDSYVSDWKEADADTQAVWAYNTTGPLKIVNNYLEAAGENIMFGGADSAASTLIPSDIEIRNNYIFKPLSWIGSKWQVKNLLELKIGQRVLITGNRLENIWPAAQTGWAMTVSPRNQDGGAPWTITQDITIAANTFLNLGQGLRIGATDSDNPSQRTSRVLVKNNLVVVTGLNGADGRLFEVLQGPSDVAFDHNTGIITGGVNTAHLWADDSPPAANFTYTNNLTSNGMYGVKGTGLADGLPTISSQFSNYTFAKNAIIGGNSSVYPSGNFFPASVSAVQFVNASGGDYRLASGSPYKNAGTDGLDIGAAIGAAATTVPSTPATTDTVPKAPTNLEVN